MKQVKDIVYIVNDMIVHKYEAGVHVVQQSYSILTFNAPQKTIHFYVISWEPQDYYNLIEQSTEHNLKVEIYSMLIKSLSDSISHHLISFGEGFRPSRPRTF